MYNWLIIGIHCKERWYNKLIFTRGDSELRFPMSQEWLKKEMFFSMGWKKLCKSQCFWQDKETDFCSGLLRTATVRSCLVEKYQKKKNVRKYEWNICTTRRSQIFYTQIQFTNSSQTAQFTRWILIFGNWSQKRQVWKTKWWPEETTVFLAQLNYDVRPKTKICLIYLMLYSRQLGTSELEAPERDKKKKQAVHVQQSACNLKRQVIQLEKMLYKSKPFYTKANSVQ